MALELTILVGTMTGTAQLVAQEVELTLDDADTRVQTKPMDGLDASEFSQGGLFLICSSTYGQGDVPGQREEPLRVPEEHASRSLRRAIRSHRARRPHLCGDLLQRGQALRRDPLRAGSTPHRRDHASRRERRDDARGIGGGLGERMDRALSQGSQARGLSRPREE